MAHVGDVFDVPDFEAVAQQGAAEPVGHHIGAEVADMGVAVDGGAAGIHPRHARLGGFDGFNPFRQGVVDAQQSNSPFPADGYSVPRRGGRCHCRRRAERDEGLGRVWDLFHKRFWYMNDFVL